MKTIQVTPPAEWPVTMDAVKDYLRIPRSDTTVDALISPLIATAVDRAQDETGRALITQTWALVFGSWQDLLWIDPFSAVRLEFPLGNLQRIDALQYLDLTGSLVTVGSDTYAVDGLGGDHACIVFSDHAGFKYPDLYDVDPVRVQMTCGYGDDSTSVPDPIKMAIKVMVGDLFDGTDSDKTIQALLKAYKLVDF